MGSGIKKEWCKGKEVFLYSVKKLLNILSFLGDMRMRLSAKRKCVAENIRDYEVGG